MLGRSAGSILPHTRTRSRNCRSRLAPRRVTSGIAFAGALLIFATAWSQTPRSDPSHASSAPAKPRPALDAGHYAQAGSATDTISDINHLVSPGTKTPSFLGYLEFDWDLDRTGDMPGFGEWMPSATSIEAAGTNPLRK
jgi:hypothetical protein